MHDWLPGQNIHTLTLLLYEGSCHAAHFPDRLDSLQWAVLLCHDALSLINVFVGMARATMALRVNQVLSTVVPLPSTIAQFTIIT